METLTPTVVVKAGNAPSAEAFEAVSIPHSILSLVPYNTAMEISRCRTSVDEHGRLRVVMAFGNDALILQQLQLCTGRIIRPTVLDKDAVLRLIAKHYGALAGNEQRSAAASPEKRQERLTYNQTSSTVGIVNDIIHEAIRFAQATYILSLLSGKCSCGSASTACCRR